jgi:uncharacterized protein (TIGR02172 family)
MERYRAALGLSMKGKLIAKGATADIYEWEDGTILKQFHKDFPSSLSEKEFSITRELHTHGISTPEAIDLIEVDGSLCLIYERIHGKEVADILTQAPYKVFGLVRKLAELHASIHQTKSSVSLDSFKDRLRNSLREAKTLSDLQRDWLMRTLEDLPEGEAICHGDYHLRNVLVDEDGKFFVIDWLTAVRGHPMADVARSYILFSERHAEDFESLWMQLLLRFFEPLIARIYIQHYLSLTGTHWSDLEPWLPLVAAARLREPSAKHEQLKAMLRRWIPL